MDRTHVSGFDKWTVGVFELFGQLSQFQTDQNWVQHLFEETYTIDLYLSFSDVFVRFCNEMH